MDMLSCCVDHCRRWLAANGLVYGPPSREAFARAHPLLCGRAYEVTLRGYERWLARTDSLDDLDTFGAYLAGRFERSLLLIQGELPLLENSAHAIDIQEMVERTLVGEHQVRWANAGRYAQQSRDALAMTRHGVLESNEL